VLPVGEPLAEARIRCADGTTVATSLRRRFEVNEGIIGWGSMAFLAVPHLAEEPVDWRGPHERLGTGRIAPPGHAGPLTVLPGAWGGSQTGVSDNVPSATDDLMLWLHAIDVRGADGRASHLVDIELGPLDGDGSGRLVVLAAVTAFRGTASPLRWLPRQPYALVGAAGRPVSVDLGVVARRTRLSWPEPPTAVRGWGAVRIAGWAESTSADGSTSDGPTGAGPATERVEVVAAELVEVAAAQDAVADVGGVRLHLATPPGHGSTVDGSVRVEPLPIADRLFSVRIEAADGRPAAARVRAVARDGRYLPPLGHRDEVNPALYEDLGADVLLDGRAYAYVPGTFEVAIPADGAILEVVAGPDVAPVVTNVEAEAGAAAIVVRLGDPIRLAGGRWVSGDTHVHFLAPSTALLQARAEGVNVVHLLATQWGDHHTSVTDLGADLVTPDGAHAVWVGSENRQNMLGHVGLVGTRAPMLPFVSGGAPEGPLGAPVTHLMADWLRRCRELGGLAIGAHFPLPMAEVAADIDAGLLDALEMQCFDATLESPPIREWYRYLDAGYRLPIVGGTDKMSATVPLGQIRTWARLEDDALTFETWAPAVRAGRTFVTSGPILELSVDGLGPGDTLQVGAEAHLQVELTARASQAIVSDIELVMDGVVVASESADPPARELVLRHGLRVAGRGWIAGRSRSPYAIGSAFTTAMAAHTSAIYLSRPGGEGRRPDLAVPLALVDGTRAWLEHLAPLRDDADLAHWRAFLDDAERRLRERSA
jgi:hypothetical protein